MTAALLVYGFIVAGLVTAEYRRARAAQIILKTAAAIGFCAVALYSGALSSLYGQIILAALAFCALGDICLLSRDMPPLFQAGMAAFAAGHVLYVAAFAVFGVSYLYCAAGFIMMALFSFLTFRYLKSHLPKVMIGPVAVYHIIITLMVAAAIGTQNWALIIPALMFAVSDMFVGRDRFVMQGPVNALMITPLYFGAQALFALSV